MSRLWLLKIEQTLTISFDDTDLTTKTSCERIIFEGCVVYELCVAVAYCVITCLEELVLTNPSHRGIVRRLHEKECSLSIIVWKIITCQKLTILSTWKYLYNVSVMVKRIETTFNFTYKKPEQLMHLSGYFEYEFQVEVLRNIVYAWCVFKETKEENPGWKKTNRSLARLQRN